LFFVANEYLASQYLDLDSNSLKEIYFFISCFLFLKLSLDLSKIISQVFLSTIFFRLKVILLELSSIILFQSLSRTSVLKIPLDLKEYLEESE